MPERGSSKHGPRQDDELRHETDGMIRSNKPSNRAEWRDPEPPADDDPQPRGWQQSPATPQPDHSGSHSERDVASDQHVAGSRATGGRPGDEPSTTGPGESSTFVGRTAGEDRGYAGQTGAEARAEKEREQHDGPGR